MKKQKDEFLTWQCGNELMSQDELAVMDGGKCILQLRGVRPFLSDKYDISKHPNFQYTTDTDKKNAFDMLPKTRADGKDRGKNKRTDTEDMPDKWCGDSGRVCREGSHTSPGIGTATPVGKQAGPVYEGENVPKITDGIWRVE